MPRQDSGHGNHAEQVPCGLVVLAPSEKQAAPAVTETDLLEFATRRLGSMKGLNWRIQVIEAVPRSPAGKILRRELLKKMAVGI
jgi:acyl-coenzyme A synthetase/AMP-(fatty) acid ligase